MSCWVRMSTAAPRQRRWASSEPAKAWAPDWWEALGSALPPLLSPEAAEWLRKGLPTAPELPTV